MKILFGCSLLLSLTALADPTKPPPSWQAQPESAQLKAQAEVVQLQLIKRSEAGNVAIINGRQLRRGDLIVSVQCPLEHCGTLLREVLR